MYPDRLPSGVSHGLGVCPDLDRSRGQGDRKLAGSVIGSLARVPQLRLEEQASVAAASGKTLSPVYHQLDDWHRTHRPAHALCNHATSVNSLPKLYVVRSLPLRPLQSSAPHALDVMVSWRFPARDGARRGASTFGQCVYAVRAPGRARQA